MSELPANILDPTAVALALAQLRAEGDEHAAAELLHLLDGGEEEQVDESVLDSLFAPADPYTSFLCEHGFTGTDPRGVKWVDGKPQKKQGEPGGGNNPARASGAGEHNFAEPGETSAEKINLAGIADSPEVKDRPGVLDRIKRAAAVTLSTVRRLVYDAALHTPQILSAFGQLYQDTDDLKKIGFNPTAAADVQHGNADALQQHLGVSTHLATAVLTRVVPAAVAWVKKKLAARASESGVDIAMALAELTRAILAAAAEQLGTPEPDAVEAIADRIRAKLEGGK